MYKKYEGMIKSLAHDYFSVHADAEDAVQEVSIKLAEATHPSLPENEEGAWIYVVVSNAYKDILRKMKRQAQQPPILVEELIDTNDPYEYAAQEEAALAIASNYTKLPESVRETCYLRYQKGLSYDAISDVQGIPIGTVGSRLVRARALLADE